MNIHNQLEFTNVNLNVFKYNMPFAVSDELDQLIQVEKERYADLEHMRYIFKARIAGEQLDRVKYPADWWQAFKERWFPKKLLRKYPVKYTVYEIRALYPKVSLPELSPMVCVYRMDGEVNAD